MTNPTENPLSYAVNIAVLPSKGMRVKLTANDQELAELARQSGALGVERFDAEMWFRRWHKKGVSVSGELYAEITQECVVTLDPVDSEIHEEFERTFVPDGSKLSKPRLNDDGELVLDYEGADLPDIFTGDSLDAWEIALEHFLLAIDPFPRREGAEVAIDTLKADQEQKGVNKDKNSPFSALKDLLNPENEDSSK